MTGPGRTSLLFPLLFVLGCTQPPDRAEMHRGSGTEPNEAARALPRNTLVEGVAAASPAGTAHQHATAHGEPVTEVPKSFGTTTCAVSGDAILEFGTAVIIEQNGEQVYLCCRGCIKDFDKDPEFWLGKIHALQRDPASWVDSLAVSAPTPASRSQPSMPGMPGMPSMPGMPGMGGAPRPEQTPPRSPAPVAVIDFERDIGPLLVANCLTCHGPTRQKSGFRLDSRDAAVRGGSISAGSGDSAIVPGDPSNSRLLWMLRAEKDDFARDIYPMPPDGPLNPAEITRIERWIAEGAPWAEGLTLELDQ